MSGQKTYQNQLFKRIIDLGKVTEAEVDDLVRIWRVGTGDEKAITLANFVATVDADLGTGGTTLTDMIAAIEAELDTLPTTYVPLTRTLTINGTAFDLTIDRAWTIPVLDQVLTGYTVGANTALDATDTILGAFQKVQGQINARVSGTIASGQVAFGTGVNTIGGATDLTWDVSTKTILIGSAKIINKIIAGEANNLEIQSGGLSGITVIRPSNNSASRFYIIPNQNQAGTGGKLDLFHTDYISFPDDYSGSTWFTSGASNTVFLGNNRAGTATRFSFVIGGDFVGSGIQSTSPRIDFNTDNTLILNKTGGNIGFGPNPSPPAARFSFYENNTGTGDSNGIQIEQAGTGDSILQFLLTGARRWVIGADNSDGDSFKISPSADVGVNYYFNLTTSGNLGLGLNTSPTDTLDVNGTARIRTIANATGNFVTTSATGVLQQRTAAESLVDIGGIGGTIASGQVAFGTGVNTIGGDSGLIWDNTTKQLTINTNSNNDRILTVKNLNSGLSSRSGYLASSDVSAAILVANSSTYSGTQGYANGVSLFTGSTSSGGISILSRHPTTGIITFFTGGDVLRWSFLNDGKFQSNGAQTIQTSTGNLTLATGAGNGNILIVPNGTGMVLVGPSSTPTDTLDVNGTARIRTIVNGDGFVLTKSATGVVTASSLLREESSNIYIGNTSLDYLEWNDTTKQFAVFSQTQLLHKYRGGAAGSLSIGQYDLAGNASINNVSNAGLLLATNNISRIEIEADGDVLLKKVDLGSSTDHVALIDNSTGQIRKRSFLFAADYLGLKRYVFPQIGTSDINPVVTTLGTYGFRSPTGSTFQFGALGYTYNMTMTGKVKTRNFVGGISTIFVSNAAVSLSTSAVGINLGTGDFYWRVDATSIPFDNVNYYWTAYLEFTIFDTNGTAVFKKVTGRTTGAVFATWAIRDIGIDFTFTESDASNELSLSHGVFERFDKNNPV